MSFPQFAGRFFRGLRRDGTSRRIAIRQMTDLRKHVISLYALLCISASALAVTFHSLAPAWLTVGAPALLILFSAIRAVQWGRFRPQEISPDEAVSRLRKTTVLTGLFSAAYVSWAMALDGYAGPYEHGHVAIFVAVTVVACIFCLTHLPVAAFLVTAIVMSVFLFHCLTSGNAVFVAIALNIVFVTIVMVRILANNFLAFVQLVESQAQTERLIAENARLAHTDSLTELPNRRHFFQQLDALIADAASQNTQFVLGIFDLDRFKPINDTYGHKVGDKVLIETGRRLSSFADPGITIARLGGDEFGILVSSPGSAEEVIAFGNRVCEALQQPIGFGETRLVTGCSGGLALYPAAGRTAAAIFDRADYALYHSKESRRGATTLFSQQHEDAIRSERAVEATLRSADLATEMELEFQPILDVATGEIAMVEALARWKSAALGRVPPDRFIAAAERCGMIHSLTLLLFGKALAHAAHLPQGVSLSFNLSSQDLVSPETVVGLLSAVRKSGLDPKRITLELTETAVMRDFDRARDAVATLRATGMQIALDDFGTGYSSLGYVHRLPLDKIKIDRSFMADIGSDLGHSIVATVLDLCQNLRLDCIAEGIETPEQLDAVRRFGCRYVQGYLIGAPASFAATLKRIRELAVPGEARRRA